MSVLIEIEVAGEARPQGTLVSHVRPDGKRFLRHGSSKRLESWRSDIRAAAAEAMNGREAYRGAVKVDLRFYVPRPQGHFGARGLRPSAPAYPIKRSKGDIDKLTRTILDSLSGIVIADDAQVVDARLAKRFADDRLIGASICVETLDEFDVMLERDGETP